VFLVLLLFDIAKYDLKPSTARNANLTADIFSF
jgi:hypothetical protein